VLSHACSGVQKAAADRARTERVLCAADSAIPVRRTWVLLAASLLLLAGCAEKLDGEQRKRNAGGVGAPKIETIPAMTALVGAEKQVLVSPPGHRLAEFMVAKNPKDPNNLVIGSQDYDSSASGTMQCVVYVSKDGGATWAQSKPIPGLDRPHLQFDNWISFDQQGVAHLICLDYANGASTQPFYSNSADGGITWAPATQIQTLGNCDKSALHAARDGRVYAACSSRVARTDDAGKKWLPAVQATSTANGFVEDTLGNIYLMGRSQGGAAVHKSTDRGETWKPTVTGPINIPPGYNDQNRWARQEPWTTLPTIAISPVNDHIFVAQQSWNTATNVYDTSVYRSTDGVSSFEKMTTPTFTSTSCTPCSVTKPSVTLDDQGRLALEVQLVNDGGHIKEVMFSASSDEGLTWLAPIVLSKTAPPNEWQGSRAFTPMVGPGSVTTMTSYLASKPTDASQIAIGLALTSAVQELQMRWNGEYWGITSSPLGFVAIWIDHSAGGAPHIYSKILTPQ
jgi:hypothetical protein